MMENNHKAKDSCKCAKRESDHREVDKTLSRDYGHEFADELISHPRRNKNHAEYKK